MKNKQAFLTGSHVYGTPNEDSDVDLVVFMHWKERKALFKALVEEGAEKEVEATLYGETGQANIKIGPLNLIIVQEPEDYDIWWKGTRNLKNLRRPVTRDVAVRTFRRLRKAACRISDL